jgi:hypothetical protein
MRSKTADRPCLNSIDRQRTTVDAPAGPGAQVFVVVAQMPYQIGDLVVGDAPMVRDAGDAAQRIVGVRPGRVHLADDRVLCARDTCQRGHRRSHAVAAPAVADGIKGPRRVRQPQFCCVGE